MIELRSYQKAVKEAVFDYWSKGGGNHLVEMATGTGKSFVIGDLIKSIANGFGGRVLVLVHVRELVAQNYAALLKLWPNAPAGIYSASLGKRDAHHHITFASIQSVYRKAKELGPRDVILIGEAHLVPTKNAGMYRQFIDDLKGISDVRIVGFSAHERRAGFTA